MSKVAMVCNGSEPKNLYPAFILGSSAIASGDDLILFFTPGGAPALKKGEFEKIKGKGMPDFIDLAEGIEALGGRIMLCAYYYRNIPSDIEKKSLSKKFNIKP